jgi:hypothetical protein
VAQQVEPVVPEVVEVTLVELEPGFGLEVVVEVVVQVEVEPDEPEAALVEAEAE